MHDKLSYISPKAFKVSYNSMKLYLNSNILHKPELVTTQ